MMTLPPGTATGTVGFDVEIWLRFLHQFGPKFGSLKDDTKNSIVEQQDVEFPASPISADSQNGEKLTF